MKKLVLLVVLALTLTASMAGAVSWTSYLTAVGTSDAVKVTVNADWSDVHGAFDYLYTVSNFVDGNNYGYTNHNAALDEFNITFPSNVSAITDITVFDLPTGWSYNAKSISAGITQIAWNTSTNPIPIDNGIQTFSFYSRFNPWQVAKAAAINGYGFSGPTMVPTPVPEASTMVGFGSALLMAGPGMIGWIRRRRS